MPEGSQSPGNDELLASSKSDARSAISRRGERDFSGSRRHSPTNPKMIEVARLISTIYAEVISRRG